MSMKNIVGPVFAAGVGLLVVLAMQLSVAQVPAALQPPQEDPSSAFRLGPWGLLAVISISGFFGGMVDGLRAERSYKWRFGNFAKEWGTLGDALVGVTASLAIFAFAENIFGVDKYAGPVQIFPFLKLVAWGVLSGYAGTKLLDTLTSKAIKSIAQEAAAQAVKEQVSSKDEAQESLSEARSLVTRHLALVKSLPPNQPDAQALELLDNAKRKYDLILRSDPANLRAQLALANLHSYRGQYLHKAGDPDSLASFDKAISAVDDLIRRQPTMAKAYYNRACYRALKAGRNEVPGEAVEDLLKAFELDDSFREYWKGDSDLESLRQDKRLTERLG